MVFVDYCGKPAEAGECRVVDGLLIDRRKKLDALVANCLPGFDIAYVYTPIEFIGRGLLFVV